MKPRSIPTHTVSRATLLATSLGLSVMGHAAETTITKADNADALNLTTSWSGGVAPGASEIALWNSTVTAANSTVLGGDLSWSGIRIADPGGAVSIGAGNTLTLGSAGIDMSLASQDLSLANALAIGAAQTWNVSVGQTLTVTGAMSGSGGIAKSGPGTLVLGAGNPSYSGAVTVKEGSVQLSASGALGTGNALTIGASGGAADPTVALTATSGSTALGSITVPSSVTGATVSMPQNSVTISHTIAGATLSSPLTFAQSNATSPRWTQITWTAPITGSGGASGNDTLVFNNTSGMQNYFTTNAGVVHSFSGNVHLKAGLVAVQNGAANSNQTIPDASMLWAEAGEWRWNTGGVVETIDGLRGGALIGNPQNCTLTINANNPSNDGNRSFSGTLGNMAGALTLGGSGLQEFSGNNVTFTNATNLNNGTLKLTKTGAWGSSITMGASNAPKVQLNAPLAADAWDFKKVVSGGSAGASLEKTGDGAVTLTAGQTFTGTTTVSGGTLKLQSTDYPTAMPAIPGMRVWLDAADPDGDTIANTADGTGIATWKNKGTLGAGADFTVSTAGTNNPTYKASVAAFNNKPTINFVAADKMLANTVNYGNTVSVVYVGRIGATKQRLVSGGTTNWILGYHGGNMGANYWNGGVLGSAADTNPHVWINGANAGTNMLGYRFDAAGETALGNGTGGAGPTTGLTLGGGWNVTTASPTERSDGDIAELFVFDHQLTTTERVQLEGYLYNKYFGSQFPPALAGFNSTGSVGVASNASFGGYGGAGNTTVAAGGTLLAGNSGTGALTLNSLTFSGAATVTGSPTTTAAPLVVTGALSTAGANTVSLATPALGVGTYHMIQYGSFGGSVSAFKFPAPTRNMVLANNPPYIDVVVSAASAFPIWKGTGGGEWSYNTGLGNWKLSTTSGATDFMANDAVLFDDTVGAGTTAVSVGVSNVSPGVITFNNSSKNYSLTQANGMDINTGSLVKTGTGTLTISGSFTFPGGASLNGGLVSIDSPSSLGTGGCSFNGSTLAYTGATGTMAGGTTLNAGGGAINVTSVDTTLTVGTLSTSGTGSLTKQGDGALSLTLGTGTYSNAIAINGGTLGLNYGTNGAILTGNITGGSSGVLRLDGAGASATSGLTLSGNNTFSGETQIFTGRRIFLDSPVGNAISGDLVVKQGEYPIHGVTLLRDEQIANTSTLRFEGLTARYDIRLNGHTETLAGIVCDNGQGRIGNAGNDGGADTGAAAGTLIVSGPGVYSYNGNLLDQSGGTNGALSFTKSGAGTQTLTGTAATTGITYTGATTVNSGILELLDTTAFVSPVTVNGGTLKLSRTSGTWTVAVPIGGAGGVEKAGVGEVVFSGAKTYTGPTTITDGSLSITGTSTSPLIDVQVAGSLKSTTVGTGTTVKGNGALIGVTFGSGSTFAPGTTGSAIEMMTADGTITFAAGSTCAMNVDRTGGVITNDRLDGADAIVYGGTLTVTATGQAFVAGNVVSLFPNATTYGGGFTTTNLPVLGAGLSWDLSQLTVDGSMKVVSSVPTPVFNPPAGGYIGAQSLTLSSASGSTIYYTLDGSTPTISSPNGPSPITSITVPTNSNVTIKAFAKKAGQADSPVTTAVYHTLDLPVWTLDGSGSWQDTVNWQGSVLAQGNGVIANFGTLTTTGANEVFLDGPRTVGQLIFGDLGDQFGWTLSAGTSGSLILNNGANSPLVNVANQTATISAPVSSGNGLLKVGPGKLVLNDVNSISGALVVRQGTLEANNAGAFGAAGNTVTLGDASTGANPVELSFGSGVAGKVSLSSVANSNFGTSQQITINAGSGLAVNAAALETTLNLAGSKPITLKALNTGGHGTAQDVNWRIIGTGIPAGSTALVLDGSAGAGVALRTSQMNDTSVASNFTGDVLIKGPVTTQGRTYLTNTAENQNLNFLQNNVTVESGNWAIVWGGETIGALKGAGNVVLNCQSALNNIGLTLGNNNQAGTHTGVISGGFALSKVGTANQTLGGANTYSGGTTVNAGTLTLTNTTGSSTGSGAVTVKSGATLAGTGIASNTTTVETGGTIAPGASGTGTLTLATASMAGTYQCQLDGANGDALTVTGALTIQPGAAINVSTLGTPTAASYTILTYSTLTNALPTITGVPSGYTVDTSTTGQVKLVGGNAFDSWINGFASLTNPADKTATADPDNDGYANIIEFVLNGNPTNGGITNRPTLTNSGGNMVFTYTRRDDSESLNPTVEFDADIAGVWTTAVDGSNCTIVVTENGANPDTVTVTIPKGANTKLFARLKVNP